MSLEELAKLFEPAPAKPIDTSGYPEWTKRCATIPRQHQVDGVEALLRRKFLLLADEVGGGKSKQVVDTAQLLFEAREIDAVLVNAPAAARGVWANPNPAIGEIAKHSWPSVPYAFREYSVANDDMFLMRGLTSNRDLKDLVQAPFLRWVVTNYEFVRREDRLAHLISWLRKRRFWLVCDEAWALKDQNTAQWEATYEIRRLAQRVVLLNGTPIADTPMDLNAQMRMLDENILGFPYINAKGKRVISCADSRFKAYYAGLAPCTNREQGMKQNRAWSVLPLEMRWPRLEELRKKVEPHVIRRRTRDCFDLPPILPPITIEARLTEKTWKIYTQMKTDMIAWLDTKEASVAKQTMVKALRLAQITSGFIGGVQEVDLDGGMESWLGTDIQQQDIAAGAVNEPKTQEIGREKLDALIAWLATIEQPERLLIWCRFRAEVERTAKEFSLDSKHRHLARRAHLLYGEQKRPEREAAIAALNPDIEPGEPIVVVGNPQAGGAGLNLAGASLAVSLSDDFNLRIFLQKRGRIDRPGQRHPIRYVDVVATGPKGQRTINHHTLAALRDKEDIAAWTAATWRQKLLEE